MGRTHNLRQRLARGEERLKDLAAVGVEPEQLDRKAGLVVKGEGDRACFRGDGSCGFGCETGGDGGARDERGVEGREEEKEEKREGQICG
jgi:hypothetical protein